MNAASFNAAQQYVATMSQLAGLSNCVYVGTSPVAHEGIAVPAPPLLKDVLERRSAPLSLRNRDTDVAKLPAVVREVEQTMGPATVSRPAFENRAIDGAVQLCRQALHKLEELTHQLPDSIAPGLAVRQTTLFRDRIGAVETAFATLPQGLISTHHIKALHEKDGPLTEAFGLLFQFTNRYGGLAAIALADPDDRAKVLRIYFGEEFNTLIAGAALT